jgi:integrase
MSHSKSNGELAEAVDGAWQAVTNRSSAQDKKAIAELRHWLASQPNSHAALLSMSAAAGSPDERSARELEALLLGRVAKREISRTTAAQNLYLLHRVGKRLRNQDVPVAPTWVSSLLRPPPSPFPRDTATVVAKVEAWRHALIEITSKPLPNDGPSLWAITALSSVCNGALLDRGKLSRLRLTLERNDLNIERASTAGPAFLDFLMPFESLGNHHLQRWWPDPVTELLLLRFPAASAVCRFKDTIKLMQEVLASAGVPSHQLPSKMTDLVRSVSIWWALRCAPVDLHVMQRTFASHSLTSRCWSRLIGHPPKREPGAVRNPGRAPAIAASDELTAEEELWLAATAEHPWLGEIRDVLLAKDLDRARRWADAFLHTIDAGDYRRPYVGWLCAALAVPPKNEKIGIGLDALATPFLLAAPRLVCYFSTENAARIDLARLDETYRVILDACEPQDPVEKIARGLRLFHAYLINEHGAQPLADPRATFGEGGALMPVDSTLISIDEYLAAHDWLEQQLQFGADPVDTMICQVVLTLTFRVGLRRGEVFHLRLCDIHDRAGIYLHVRRYPGHRLKTPNSTRTVRIDALLSMHERTLLRRWIASRRAALSGLDEDEQGQSRLIAHFEAIDTPASVDGTVRKVLQALHAVTNEPRLVLHHLRHACASWLWLKLRAPDYPELQDYISTMPALCRELRRSRRLRTLLCGAAGGPSRTYSNVVARVLGHGMPVTSLEHYIHVADLFLAATTTRAAAGLPVSVWQGLTGATRSTAYAWLKRGPHGIVAGFRAKKALATHSSTTPPAGSGPSTSPWRKRAAPPPVRFRSDTDIGSVSRALNLYNRLDEAAPHKNRVAAVAERCQLDESTVEQWVEAARAIAPAFGMKAPSGLGGHLFRPVPVPDADLHRATVEALDDLAIRMSAAARDCPRLLSEALVIAASRFNLRRYDVCFRGQHDEIAARRFLKALSAMGMLPDGVRLTVRRTGVDDTKLPHWFRSARVRGLAVKRLPPPGTSESQAKAYARWVGVQLCDAEGAAAGHAWRIALFLACVAYEPAQCVRTAMNRSSDQSTTP